jgi:hypothetical protein
MKTNFSVLLVVLILIWLPHNSLAQPTPDFTPEQHYLFDPSVTGAGDANRYVHYFRISLFSPHLL